jgi:2-polyprenyl-3-methyl-5-hydroxy-6-metoxy-1,4-benzoquinol methylase
VLGALFLWMHVRSRGASTSSHFDAIADAYAAQIPEGRRLDLLSRKTRLMRQVIRARSGGTRGIDVGCGPGWYVRRMRQDGFDVRGIDESEGQVAEARRNVEDAACISRGSMLEIPAPTGSHDFVYCINVLHHLSSVEQQRAAFAELERVLRPGGLLFVHEINVRNPIFRLYMGYLFPLLNCIDEGVERWLLPHRLESYTSTPVVETHYFTFLPEFLPEGMVRLFRPIERLLEASPLRLYSAHYMAVLRKAETA